MGADEISTWCAEHRSSRERHYGENSDEHVYLVTVEDGAAIEYTCPADEYQDKCKHRHAVMDRPALLRAGSASMVEMREAREQ